MNNLNERVEYLNEKPKIKEHWQDVVNEAKDTYAATKQTARDVVYIVRDKSRKLNDNLCDSVSANPWKTILLASAFGWVIGKFAKFKFDKDQD